MIDMDAVRMEVEAARGELVDAGNVKGILSLPARTRIWRAMLDPQDAERSYVYDEIEDFDAVTQPAAFVANGAVSLVGSALDRSLDFDVVGDIEDDDELLPDSLETSYCCASAAAGALNWQPIEDTDVDARRAFWLWYLDEAIPAVLAD